jgi:predicted anti-sigma-YlaC factor YlaD
MADGFVEEGGTDGGIDPARETADDSPVADGVADTVHLGVEEVGHAPGAGASAGLVEEVLEDVYAMGGVCDLGMELDAQKRK